MDSLPSAKELKKLADACRKAGIKMFKGYGIEFTLSDELPVSNYKKKIASKQEKAVDSATAAFESDSLTQEQLLMWSVQGIAESDSQPE